MRYNEPVSEEVRLIFWPLHVECISSSAVSEVSGLRFLGLALLDLLSLNCNNGWARLAGRQLCTSLYPSQPFGAQTVRPFLDPCLPIQVTPRSRGTL